MVSHGFRVMEAPKEALIPNRAVKQWDHRTMTELILIKPCNPDSMVEP